MKNKVTIHQFDPVIYPRKLWIVSTKDEKIIKNNFTERDGKEMVFEDSIGNEPIASVISCTQKGSGFYGFLIWIQDNKKFDVGSFAHESVHVASQMFYDMGMQMGFTDGRDEHYAYLVGWIADCINQVKTNKFKD